MGRWTKTSPLSTSTQIRLWRIQCARLVDPIAFAPSRHQHIRCLQREEDGETWGNEGNVVRISLVRVVGEYMSLVNGGRRRCAPHHSFPQGMQKYPWRLQRAEIMQILDPFPWGLLFFLYIFVSVQTFGFSRYLVGKIFSANMWNRPL